MKPDKKKQELEVELRNLADQTGDIWFSDRVVEYLDKHDESARLKKEEEKATKGGWANLAALVVIPLILVKVLD